MGDKSQKLRLSPASISLPTPLQTVRELLENPAQPINDMSYFGCLDSVMENSKVCGKGPRRRNGPGVRTYLVCALKVGSDICSLGLG